MLNALDVHETICINVSYIVVLLYIYYVPKPQE